MNGDSDQPRYYAVRRVNPFEGVLQVVETHNARAYSPNGYVWQVQDLAIGQGGVITITGLIDPSVTGTFTLTNRATIFGDGPERNLGNNTASEALAVDGVPPEPPTLSSPVDGSLTADTTPVLAWNASGGSDATGYLLDLDGTVMDLRNTTHIIFKNSS